MAETAQVRECWTDKAGWRQVGDGPWEIIDLELYGGRPPVLLFNEVKWVIETTLITKKEAEMLGYSK